MNNNKLNTNSIVFMLIRESDISKPGDKFKRDLLNKLHNQNKKPKFNIYNFLTMKSKSIQYKIMFLSLSVLILTTTIMAISKPTLATEVVDTVKECGINIQCYDRLTKAKNKYGMDVEVYEQLDKTGKVHVRGVGLTKPTTIEENEKFIKNMGGTFVEKTKDGLIYKLKSGTFVTIKLIEKEDNASEVEFFGTFHNDFELYQKEVFGDSYDFDQKRYDKYEKIKTEISKMNITNKSTREDKNKFFMSLKAIKSYDKQEQNGNLLKEYYTFEGKTYLYQSEITTCKPGSDDSPTKICEVEKYAEDLSMKIYDAKTGELIHQYDSEDEAKYYRSF